MRNAGEKKAGTTGAGRGGTEVDITEIFKNYYTYIYNYALKLACHPDDAMDLTQETFIKAWEKIDTLENEYALAKWLRTICFHQFLMKMRKEKDLLITDEDWDKLEQEGNLWMDITPLPEDEVIVAEEIQSLQNGCFLAMVRKLSLNQRILFSLIDMFGLEIGYVADVLNISKGAAKGLLHRARMNIDSFFADHCNLIYEKNPCSCQAWIAFSAKRTNLQERAKELSGRLDFEEKNYIYREEVRRKVLFFYSHMPQQKPSDSWYEAVLKIFCTKET